MGIPFAGSISLQNFRRAQAVDGRTRTFMIMMTVLLLATVVVQIPLLLNAPSFFSLASPGIIILLVVLVWFFARWQITRAWRQNQAVFTHVSSTITNEFVKYNTAQSASTIRWILFQTYKIAPNMVLLYQNTQAFNMLLRHILSNDTDWNAFVRLVQQEIVSAKRGNAMQIP